LIDKADGFGNSKEARILEQMISEFIEESSKLLEEWKQCIFYLSEAYLEVFYGAFPLSETHKHKCCTRYFPDDEFRAKYESEIALF
jgi:hypothetical protein